MKKVIAVVTAVVILTFAGTVFAQTPDKGKEMMGDKKAMMEGKGGMMGMMGGKGMMKMMKMMHQQRADLVATPDGGVIVLSGGKLTKYDGQLNVVKEVDLPKSEMGMMDKDNDDDDKASDTTKPAEDHAAHH